MASVRFLPNEDRRDLVSNRIQTWRTPTLQRSTAPPGRTSSRPVKQTRAATSVTRTIACLPRYTLGSNRDASGQGSKNVAGPPVSFYFHF